VKEQLLTLFRDHPDLAIAISLLVSIVVAVLGLVPSVFITAANILFFGFWKGTMVSLAGEAIGAFIAFLLYRKGLRNLSRQSLQRFPRLQRLLEAEGREAFMLIFSLRLLPFVPSGLVTFAAAIGKVSATVFFFASTLGKIPALLIEAWSVYQVTEFGWQGKLVLAVVGVFLVYLVIRQYRNK
jgi:uncharacterized membrane protein YdjX (TVP38/TMEM64 family)